MNPKAFSYVRMSTPEQMKGDSLRRQLEKAHEWAAENGYELDDTLRDLGVSAFRGLNRDRKALREFVDKVEAGEIERGSVLVVESLDRISRQTVIEALAFFLDVINAGIVIVTLGDKQIYSKEILANSWSPLLVSLTIMARAHEESKLKGDRVRAAWTRKRERAQTDRKPLTARCPAWIELRNGEYHLIPKKADIIRGIISDLAAGVGKRAIARRLNADGVPPVGRSGTWHESYITKILETDAAAGFFLPHQKIEGRRIPEKEPIANYYPPVVTLEELSTTRAAVRSRRNRGGQGARRYGNLFTGLLYCAKCGGPMHFVDKGKSPKGGRYVRCDRAIRNAKAANGFRCDHRQLYRYDELELGVVHTLSPRVVAQILDAETNDQRRLRMQIATAAAQISDAERRLNNYLPLIEEGGGPGDPVLARVRELRAQIKDASRHRDEAQAAMARTAAFAPGDAEEAYSRLKRHFESLETATFEDRAALAQMLRRAICRIRINDRGMGFVLFRSEEARAGLILFSCANGETSPGPDGMTDFANRTE